MRLNIFINVDILVLVSKFVVVAIFTEWWSVPTIADHCGDIPAIGYELATGVQKHTTYKIKETQLSGHTSSSRIDTLPKLNWYL